jgi:hypothetical protein
VASPATVSRKLRQLGERPQDVIHFEAYDLREYLRFSFGKRLIDHFKGMDSDGSGELKKKEFRKAIAAMGFVNATKESVDTSFDFLDDDHSGKLGYVERKHHRHSKLPLPRGSLPSHAPWLCIAAPPRVGATRVTHGFWCLFTISLPCS